VIAITADFFPTSYLRASLTQEVLVRKLLATAALLACVCGPASAQQVSQLNCQGRILDAPAVLSGVRVFKAYNALGDGEVSFNGMISAAGITGRMQYGGYSRVEVVGVIVSPQGTWRISVLDNSGGQMKIYDGRATLGAPNMIGQFVCDWR
jgi:hypothetical protein